MKIDIGINDADRQEIAKGLSNLLADTYTLYLKTQNFHWNVTGPQFQALHSLFEEQYHELADAVDVIAERIRALGVFAPGSFSCYQDLSTVKESRDVPSASEMVKQLVADHETLVRTARSVFPKVDEVNDEPTADLLTERMRTHEKTAWMLRSMVA